MSGIIPEEDEEDQETYDDVGNMPDTAEAEPTDDDIYEELPGSTSMISFDCLLT